MDFISILSIFVLACFVGYYVVWSVTPALHTPLMAVTNAISSVIIVGALIAAAAAGSPAAKWLGLVARGAGQRQHLRRLCGDRADAGDVQEEGAQVMALADGAIEISDSPPQARPSRRCARRESLGALAYLVSGVCFILALRGLSSPATSRTGNRFGMVGMLIAVVTTLVTPSRSPALPEIADLQSPHRRRRLALDRSPAASR